MALYKGPSLKIIIFTRLEFVTYGHHIIILPEEKGQTVFHGQIGNNKNHPTLLVFI